ncbi:MAG: hypothetical protein DWG77_02505 [Chloroflexi bacterium]|nr:hypothetical protein [Chloroflexota bacterium]
MTMHLPGYEAPRRGPRGVATIQEDVHVHVGLPDLRAAVADPSAYGPWLPAAITRFEADTEGLRFGLSLPGRSEGGDLRRAPADSTREVIFVQNGSGNYERLTWALFPEGQRECHLTAELVYRPASGLFGGAMEGMFHRGQRIQMLRDLLWALKRDIEGLTSAADVTAEPNEASA